MTDVGIVGGGIGGLTAAIALRARGFRVTVFERSERRGSEGVALLLWSNAMRALAGLGIDLLPMAATIEHTEVRTSRGEVLCSLPIRDWSARAAAPSVAIRRPLLIEALAGALPADVIEHGRRVTGFVQGKRVRAVFADGGQREFDVLVGADGLHSRIRAQLLGEQPIRMLQQRAWVGLSRPPAGLLRPGVTVATIGRGPRVWVAPLARGEAFWFATLNRSHVPDGSPVVFLREGLADWPAPIADVLAATRDEDVVEARICDRPPVQRWGERRVTLLGDAAHAATPDLGQGACQAIESAAALADCLSAAPEVEAGLRAYEHARMDRTATISRLCWITSLNTTIESPLLCAVRDTAIRLGLPAVARRHMAWILGGTA